jgi:hypothetical protein
LDVADPVHPSFTNSTPPATRSRLVCSSFCQSLTGRDSGDLFFTRAVTRSPTYACLLSERYRRRRRITGRAGECHECHYRSSHVRFVENQASAIIAELQTRHLAVTTRLEHLLVCQPFPSIWKAICLPISKGLLCRPQHRPLPPDLGTGPVYLDQDDGKPAAPFWAPSQLSERASQTGGADH